MNMVNSLIQNLKGIADPMMSMLVATVGIMVVEKRQAASITV